MKKIFIGILGLLFFILINGCSRNTDSQFRIRNEQLNKVNVKIQTSASDKPIFDEVENGQVTAYQSVSEGNVTATNVSQNESVSFLVAKNTHYTIVISIGKPPSVQVDQ
jgi:hypothetical protein